MATSPQVRTWTRVLLATMLMALGVWVFLLPLAGPYFGFGQGSAAWLYEWDSGTLEASETTPRPHQDGIPQVDTADHPSRFGTLSCDMSYVRSLWVVVPLTLLLVGAALGLDGFAVFSGAFVGFREGLSKCLLFVAVFGLFAAAGGTKSPRPPPRWAAGMGFARSPQDRMDPSTSERKPGEVSLTAGAAFFISSAIVAVIGILIR